MTQLWVLTVLKEDNEEMGKPDHMHSEGKPHVVNKMSYGGPTIIALQTWEKSQVYMTFQILGWKPNKSSPEARDCNRESTLPMPGQVTLLNV